MALMLDRVVHLLDSIINHLSDVLMGHGDTGPPVWGWSEKEELGTIIRMRGYKDTLKYLRERNKQKGLSCAKSILVDVLINMDTVEVLFQDHIKLCNCFLELGEKLCRSKRTGAIKLLIDFIASPELKNCKFFELAISLSPWKSLRRTPCSRGRSRTIIVATLHERLSPSRKS